MSAQLDFPELRPVEIDALVEEIDRALDAFFLGEMEGALRRARTAEDEPRDAAAAAV